uniref:4Fe-4S ferredoxin-type domain-containing protein n=1 Tax=Timema bartmani TaxID=61472 RepID=A0A7R9FCQ0_9NEOP|nr:unnamed protein product [Timema bartmani]
MKIFLFYQPYTSHHNLCFIVYREPVKYDPTFKGPLNKRSCTDVICLGLFLVFVGAWIFVGCYGFTQGDPSRLLLPTDSQGRKCGLDTEVIDKPYLFFFDLTRCIRSNVCVESCPKKNFIYSNLSNLEAIKQDIKCKTSINVSSISTVDEFTGHVDREDCARYYLSSKAVSSRCIPLTSVGNFTVVFVATFSELTKLVHNLIMEFTDSEKVHEVLNSAPLKASSVL